MKKWIRPVLFLIAGGLLGYGYASLFGCTNSCPITSNPWTTAVYFTIVGGLLSVVFAPKPKKNSK